MKAIAIDIGGSHATLAVVEDQRVLLAREIPADSSIGVAPLLPRLSKVVRELLAELALRPADCRGLAMGICAMVDHNSARVVSTNKKFDDAPGIDFPAWCRAEFSIPFALENDARMALLGEQYTGAAHGVDDVVMITLGTGIGVAVLAGGRPFRTRQVQGGCLGGHIPMLFTGRKCTCGGQGCMEAEASGWALPLIACEWPGFSQSRLAQAEPIDFRALFQLAREGDRVAIDVRNRCLRVWAAGAVGFVHVYGPERIIFGGGVMRSENDLLPYIQEYVGKYAWSPSRPVEVLSAALGSDAALVGAIPLLSGAG